VERWSIVETTPSQSGNANGAEAQTEQAAILPAALLPPDVTQSGIPSVQGSKSKLFILALAAIVVVGVIGVTAAMRGGQKDNVPTAAASTTVPTSAPSASQTPAVTASATAEASATTVASTAPSAEDTTADPGKRHTTGGTGKTAGKTSAPKDKDPAATTTATAKATSASTSQGNLPQIRNPGF